MTTDTELETWRRDWRHETEPLPELKRKVRRQNLRAVGAVVTICVCLTLSTVVALRHRSAFMAGLATGVSIASILVGGYAWWVRRGAWRPSAQTTLAYTELCYKRAVAKARTLRFSFYFLLVTVVLFAALAAWHGKSLAVRDWVIVGAMVIELFFLRYYRRRKVREVVETKKVIDDMKQ